MFIMFFIAITVDLTWRAMTTWKGTLYGRSKTCYWFWWRPALEECLHHLIPEALAEIIISYQWVMLMSPEFRQGSLSYRLVGKCSRGVSSM